MSYDGWNLLGGCRLLGAALVVLLGGDMDFKIMDGLGDWIHFSAGECELLGGGGGGRGAQRTDRFKQVFPCDVNSWDCFGCI